MVLGWLARRFVEKSERITGVEYTTPQMPRQMAGAPVTFGNLNDFTVLRNHAARALCGALMDRHSECSRQHPLCGPGHRQNGDVPTQLVARAVPQRSGVTGNDLIGIYLHPAQAAVSDGGLEDIFEYAARLSPAQPTPTHKLVVAARSGGGKYPALMGPALDSTGGDVPDGRLDPGRYRTVDCDPSPDHCHWRYWESEMSPQGRTVPMFNCLQVFSQWQVMEIDPVSGAYQHVAALDLADSPRHGTRAGTRR